MLQDLQTIIGVIINIFISSYSGPGKATGFASHIPRIVLALIVISAGFIYDTYKIAPFRVLPRLSSLPTSRP